MLCCNSRPHCKWERVSVGIQTQAPWTQHYGLSATSQILLYSFFLSCPIYYPYWYMYHCLSLNVKVFQVYILCNTPVILDMSMTKQCLSMKYFLMERFCSFTQDMTDICVSINGQRSKQKGTFPLKDF